MMRSELVGETVRSFVVLSAFAAVSVQVFAQGHGIPADSADVFSLDGTISASYDVVSGAEGEPRDTERDQSLHHPEARAIVTSVEAHGKTTTSNMMLAEYYRVDLRQ